MSSSVLSGMRESNILLPGSGNNVSGFLPFLSYGSLRRYGLRGERNLASQTWYL